jgi:hypothetical protein
MSDVIRILTVTQANLDHHHPHCRHPRLLPPDAIGGVEGRICPRSIRIEWGDGEVVERTSPATSSSSAARLAGGLLQAVQHPAGG